MSIPMDGSFYADGRRIFKAPHRKMKEDGGSTVSIGFPVAEVTKYVSDADEIAKAIADAMNAYEPLRS